MQHMTRGQKTPLDAIACGERCSVTVVAGGPGLSIDVACFGLDAQGKLSDDRYMVFYNQRAAPSGIRMGDAPGPASFELDLAALPASIVKLVFTAAIDGAGTMNQLGQGSLALGQASFSFSGADFAAEKALMIGEIYRHGDGWRFGAVGQGFEGGLSALLAHFGGVEGEQAAAPAPAPTPVRLSKVTLTKAGQKAAVVLKKGGDAPRVLVVKASWVDNGDKRANNDDLDLRAGLLLPDGRMKLISAPGRCGALDESPFVLHLGDVTSASQKEPGTETIHVNPAIARQHGGRVALVFSVYSALGNGVVSVASLKPKMRMEYGDQVVECAFDFAAAGATSPTVYTYVLGTAIITDDEVQLAPSGMTSPPRSENTPWLRWNDGKDAKDATDGVTITMDGPMSFKGKVPWKIFNASPHQYS